MTTHDEITVAVADDHPLFRGGVVSSLQAVDGITVVGQAADAAGALQVVRDHLPDVVLLDINMPGSGLAAARTIASAYPATKIVMLTVSEDEDDLLEALKAGASGYVLKGVDAENLVEVLRAVHGGEVYVAPGFAWSLLREMTRTRPAGPMDDLTTREREVLELVAAGLSNQQIGAQLELAERTVKHYMTNILAKLHVRSRVEAALLAHKAGIRSNAGAEH